MEQISSSKKCFSSSFLISQSKFDINIIDKYDDAYYYSISTGKEVDVFVIDNGIIINHIDFGTAHRTVSCDEIFNKEKSLIIKDDKIKRLYW